MSEKCLLDQWRDMAYDRSLSKDQLEKFWGTYFNIEKGIYEQLLENPDEEVRGTVKERAEKYGQEVMTMVGSMGCRSGRRSLTRRRENVCIVSRSSPERSARQRRSEEMIRARAEAERNTRSAAEEMHNR